MTSTPDDAVRAELRVALHDLADALIAGSADDKTHLNAVRHDFALLRLADLEEMLRALLERQLQQLGSAVAMGLPVDRPVVANVLAAAADRL